MTDKLGMFQFAVHNLLTWKLRPSKNLWDLVEEDHQLMLNNPPLWRVQTIGFKEKGTRADARRALKRSFVQKVETARVDSNMDLDDIVGYTKIRHRRNIGWQDDLSDAVADDRWQQTYNMQTAEGNKMMINSEGEAVAWFHDNPRSRHAVGNERRRSEGVETRTNWIKLVGLALGVFIDMCNRFFILLDVFVVTVCVAVVNELNCWLNEHSHILF
jgi:hypothetical protein